MRVILIALSLCFSISMIGQKTDFRLASTSIKIGETFYSFQAYEGDPDLEILNCTYFNPSHLYNQATDETEWHVYDMFYSQSPSGFNDDNFQPFYFKNYEVTNAEYRAFIDWVRDSIALARLGYFVQDAERNAAVDFERTGEIDWSNSKLDDLYLVDNSGKRVGFNPSSLVYNYEAEGVQQSVSVSPDTLCWVKDFPDAMTEPMTNHYFGHPAFDDYPVVGINYNQAKAFCHWIEMRLKAELKAKGKGNYHVKVDLPTAMQWQHLAWWQGGEINNRIQDFSWNTDLMLTFDKEQDAVRKAMSKLNYLQSDYYADGAVFTHVADLSANSLKKFRKESADSDYSIFHNLDDNQISAMGGNVSEWMRDAYATHWQKAFNSYIQALQDEAAVPQLAIDIPTYYNNLLTQNGNQEALRLVYGANWLDERYSLISGKNRDGIFAKTFVAGDKAHATLGFRYVVEVSLSQK